MGCKQQEQGGSTGLAYLVAHPPTLSAPCQTALLLDYVYQLPQPASDVVCRSGDISYPELNSRVVQHLTTLKQQAAASSATADAGPSSSSSGGGGGLQSTLPPEQPRGRVGPRDVTIDRSSVCGSFGFSTDGLALEALGNFTSCRANVAVFAGKWFYECTMLTSGIQQVRGDSCCHCVGCASGLACLIHPCTQQRACIRVCIRVCFSSGLLCRPAQQYLGLFGLSECKCARADGPPVPPVHVLCRRSAGRPSTAHSLPRRAWATHQTAMQSTASASGQSAPIVSTCGLPMQQPAIKAGHRHVPCPHAELHTDMHAQ